MAVLDAHGFGNEEIGKYDSVCPLDFFSIAENSNESKANPIKAFHHRHEEYEFIIPLTTIPLLYYEKAEYIGEVGFVYPVNPFVEHGIAGDLHSKVISVAIAKDYLDQLKKELGYGGEYFYTRFLYKKSLLDLIHLYEGEFAEKNGANANALASFARAISIILIEFGLESKKDNRRPEIVYAKNMKNILLYIEEHYQDPDLTIARLAEISDYSLTYFTKAFKGYMHTTPIIHLNKRRISHANVLLRETDLPLSEIARQSGYKKLSTFTEAFKRVMGVLPSVYRRKYLQ